MVVKRTREQTPIPLTDSCVSFQPWQGCRPSRPEAGKFAVRRQSESQDLRLRPVQHDAGRVEPDNSLWVARLRCAGDPRAQGIRWDKDRCVELWSDPLHYALRTAPIRRVQPESDVPEGSGRRLLIQR